jgi:hypothetical protein
MQNPGSDAGVFSMELEIRYLAFVSSVERGSQGMEIDLSSEYARKALIQATEAGSRAGCPFCAGRMVASVSVGDRIISLRGSDAGREATVTAERGFNGDEFLVHFDLEPENYETRISYSRDKFAYAPIKKLPDWLCRLSIDDLSALDDSVIHTAVLFVTSKHKIWSVETLLPILSVVRSRRLPLSGADLWLTLEAHGFSPVTQDSFENYFDFAIEVLIAMVGRPPIKRKLVGPMSIGRYLTPARLEQLGPSRGIENHKK